MKTLFFVLVVLGLFVIAQPAFTGNDPVGKAVLELTAGEKGDVTFPHKTHQTVLGDCMACHTLFPQKAGVIREMIKDGKLKKKQVMNHCLACHREKLKEGVKAGPTSCSQCHKKN